MGLTPHQFRHIGTKNCNFVNKPYRTRSQQGGPEYHFTPTHLHTYPPTHLPTSRRQARSGTPTHPPTYITLDPFFRNFFEKPVPCSGDLERLGASTHGAVGVWVRGCVGVCGCVGAWLRTHPHPPPAHPQRSAHPTHLSTDLPTNRLIVLLIEVGAVTFSRQGQGKRER